MLGLIFLLLIIIIALSFVIYFLLLENKEIKQINEYLLEERQYNSNNHDEEFIGRVF